MPQTPDTAVLAGIGCGGNGREESKGGDKPQTPDTLWRHMQRENSN